MLRHPVNGKVWKDFDTNFLAFASKPRNVQLGLAAGGFNPFGSISLSYSMWLVVLTAYNLSPCLCMKDSYFMLTLLILGPQAPGKDMDIFFRLLIDKLKELWVSRVEACDAVDNSIFTMRVAFLWNVNDFPT